MSGGTSTRRVKTPTVLQMEAVECGAAALGIVLGYHGRYVPLEELRVLCGVSRDGSRASNVVKAARVLGLFAEGKRYDVDQLRVAALPAIVFWNFNHFLVVEGFGQNVVYLNDPVTGPRQVTTEEFSNGYTGVTLIFRPGADFVRTGRAPTLWQMLPPRLKGARASFAFVVLATLGLVLPGVALPLFTRSFVDDYLIGRVDGWLVPLLLGMAATLLVRVALTVLQQSQLIRLETRLALTASGEFFWHVLRLPVEFFNQRYVGDISVRVASNDRVAQLLAGDLATNAVNLIAVAFFALVMLHYDVWLTLVGITALFLNVFVLRAVSRHRRDGNARLLQERGQLIATTMGGIETIETIKATGGEADFFSRWSGRLAKVNNAEQHLELYTRLLATLPNVLNGLVTAAILGLGGLRVLQGAMSIGTLVAFQSLMASFSQPITSLMGLAGKAQEADGDLRRLDDVLRYPAERRGPEALPPGAGKLDGRLELRGVSFGYSQLEPPLIEDFSLVLEAGQRVALVGPSGSGKSTIAKLVTGVYRPWTGEILLDGRPRDEIPRLQLEASLGSVEQEIYLFAGTVRDNLSLWDENLLPEELVRAAKDSCIHDVIAARPGGYETTVAEGGANFSGGERQRLEIARALAQVPRLLVLDEATAALDPLTEQIIDERIRQRGCACLIVAHRLSTVRDCDEIIVMDRGKIIARGRHESLVAQQGLYAELIRTEL